MKIIQYTLFLLAFVLPNAEANVDDKNHPAFEDVVNAANNGDNKSQLIVGLSYHYGYYTVTKASIKKDYIESQRNLKLSSDNGNCFASWFLGGLFHEGKGVKEDEGLAAKYFLLAAQRGNVKAQRNIAAYYLYGRSVKKDYNEAYAWASLANYNEKDNKNTQALLNTIIPKLEDREKANVYAAKHFEKYLKQTQNDCGNS